MKLMKRSLAILLAVLLMMPNLPVYATEGAGDSGISDVADDTAAVEDAAGDDAPAGEEDTTGGDIEAGGEDTPGGSTEAGSDDITGDDTSTETEEVTGDDTSAGDSITGGDAPANGDDTLTGEDTTTEDDTTTGEDTVAGDGTTTGTDTATGNHTVTGDDAIAGTDTTTGNVTPTEDEEIRTVPEEEIRYNLGSYECSVVDPESYEDGLGDFCFEEDGSFTIYIMEANPFFPYEVQFTHEGETSTHWFMSPEDTVEIGGHTFSVWAEFDNETVTQMSLNVGGDTVVVYPEKKEFTNDGSGISTYSLQPLKEVYLNVDLSAYTPVELSSVSVDSIFTGANALTDMENVTWSYETHDGYTINSKGDNLDLSFRTSAGTSVIWEMIVGEADQLASDNTRYIVDVKVTESVDWLIPTVYIQDDTGKRTELSVSESYYEDSVKSKADSYVEHELSITVPAMEMGEERKAYIGIAINPAVFGSTQFDRLEIYNPVDSPPNGIYSGHNITDMIYDVDMTQKDAGFIVDFDYRRSSYIRIVTYDASGNQTGQIAIYVTLYSEGNEITLDLFQKNGDSRAYVVSSISESLYSHFFVYDLILYEGYAANDTYHLTMDYWKAGVECNSDVTTAFMLPTFDIDEDGSYSSIAEAREKGGVDVTDTLFSDNYDTEGYAANYSEGVYIQVFIGADGTEGQENYLFAIRTKSGTESKAQGYGTEVEFSGLKDSSGADVSCYVVDKEEDSYGEYNYQTILVEEDTDLTSLALVFSNRKGAKLYASGSRSPEVSGKSLQDFSKGLVHYTSATEDGKSEKNYWVQVVKPSSGAGKLYINSLTDEDSDTREENGVIYSTREIMLNNYHNGLHDILLINLGTDAIPSLSVELTSDVVELDGYWTLSGNHGLSGFTTTSTSTSYGELANLAKIRLREKNGATSSEISGTLTVKSGDTPLMVLTLTGMIGNPGITTSTIPEAVKYVPYGTMIQNDNKYGDNRVSYTLVDGSLPGGMEIKPNGELYGVPTEAGTFEFRVRMDNSLSSFGSSQRTYTLIVAENTDANVEAATDKGYELTQRIQAIDLSSIGSSADMFTTYQTVVSEGDYAEFADVYIDGEKLISGTDYTSESGSTRITLQTATLVNGRSAGIHTLGIEFRTADNTLKRAAQNYTISGTTSSGDNSSDSGSSGSSSSSGGNDTASSAPVSAPAITVTTVTHTVASGDTLWSIAEKYYGFGQYWQKIFTDNAAVISNPDRIYVGQQLVIYLTPEGTAAVADADGIYYTIQPGDTLWKIAKEHYGKGRQWRKIYSANSNVISAPERIYAGQIIVLPD